MWPTCQPLCQPTCQVSDDRHIGLYIVNTWVVCRTTFRVRLIGKSDLDFQNLNPHFPIEPNPSVITFMQSSIITFPHITQRKKKRLKQLREQPGAADQNKAQKFIFKMTQKVKNTNQGFARNEHLNIFTALRWFQRTSVVRRHPA